MLSTQVAEIARTMLAPFNGTDPDLLDTVVAPDYVEHALPPGVPPGIASLKGLSACSGPGSRPVRRSSRHG